jgi:hypothetical protein
LQKEDSRVWWRLLILGICLVILALMFSFNFGTQGGWSGALIHTLGIEVTVLFFILSGFFLIIYSVIRLQENYKYRNSVVKYLSKYFVIRFLAGLLFMGSFGIGFLAGARYGLFVGLISFFVTASVGLILHYVADKLK